MHSTTNIPGTIAEVIEALERIIETCAQSQNRLGFFAVLYHKVTVRVQQGIQNHEFEDDRRMEHFDVVFANRYLAAWNAFQHNETCSASWLVAFRAAQQKRHLILQHLLLGMNAHINLDLGIVAAEISREQGLPAVRKDFAAINGILAMLSGEVMDELRRVSPLLSLMGLHQSRQNSLLIQFSLSNARDGAWCFAEELAAADAAARNAIILSRDQNIAELAQSILSATGLMGITLWLIHLFEWHRPGRIIQALRSQAPTFIKSAFLKKKP